MSDTKLMLVGDDGSTRGRTAVQWAARFARAMDVELAVLRVVERDSAQSVEEATRELEERDRELAVAEGVSFTCQAVTGEPRQALAEQIVALDVDLAVVGDTGHWGLVRPPLGSVASYLVHHSPRPVAVVPAPGGPLEGGRLVVGVDGSAGSRAGLAWAAATAARLHGSVVAGFFYDPLADSYPHPPQASEWHASFEPKVRAQLESVHEPGVDIELRVLGAHPVEGLLEVAADVDAALVVVGARGHGTFRRLLLGGTAVELLHHSHRPVVVVPVGRPLEGASPD